MKKRDLLMLFTLILLSFQGVARLTVGEKIDRGVIALSVSENEVYVGCRLLQNDAPKVAFNIYPAEVGTDYKKVNSSEVNIDNQLFKFKGDTLLKIEGKVMMIADILGDWREEIVTSLPGELRIYSTNIPAMNRRICMMQDRQYRAGVAASTMGIFILRS